MDKFELQKMLSKIKKLEKKTRKLGKQLIGVSEIVAKYKEIK